MHFLLNGLNIQFLTLQKISLLLLLGITLNTLQAQDSRPSIQVKYTSETIVLDGELNETTWKTAPPPNDFWGYFPSDTLPPQKQTEILMAFDDTHLYVAIKCYAAGDDYVVPSLKRDYRAGGNDNISLMFDTFNDRTNAFLFGMNPLGVRREALISNGGMELSDFQTSWDNKWKGESKIHDGFWVSEMAIPFSTLRYKEGTTKWTFNSYRFDTQSNENTVWSAIPRNQWIFNLAFNGDMIFEKPLKKAGGNIALIPYASGGITRDFEDANAQTQATYGIGGDAKIAVTSGLNLDLTVNPDFSQVEVDRQVTNLDRFEIFFPERRQFFLENADLFSSFGISRINPFFSRRIGVAVDTSSDATIQNTILGGARLSGKINRNWRVGLLNMQTAADMENDLPSFNYTVAAVQRKVFSRSNIGLIFVNKENFTNTNSETYDPFNRIFGLDYNIASSNNAWTGKVFYHQSLSPEQKEGNEFAHGFELNYKERLYSIEYNHQYVGEDFEAQVGFVPRSNYFRINPEARLYFYPNNGFLNQHGPGLEVATFWSPENGRTDQRIELYWDASLAGSGRMRVWLQNDYTLLTDPFDPSGTDSAELPALSDYNYTSFRARYNSDRRKKFSYRLEPLVGQYFNGHRYALSGSFNYRFQPYGSVALNYSYNYIDLPEPYAQTSLFLVGPRIDITFTKKIFLTTFIQYNNQIDNININARFQWRFAPVSDFFLVYTDNYYSTDLKVKNRAIIAKFTYWLNL